MAESSVRVALLARPGPACEHLQAALQQAGAEVVLVADPLGSDAGSVAASSPGAILVALDPAVEEVLDRYDPILLDPAMTVIYDEADLAAKREGWDLARWTRHLAAKLAGHDDVLPPGSGVDEPRATHFEPTLAFEPAPVFEPAASAESFPEPQPEPTQAPTPAPEPIFEFELDGVGDDAIATTTTEANADDGGISFSGIVPDGELSLDALEFDIAAPEPAQPEAEPAPAAAAVDANAAAAERPTFDFSALSLEELPGEAAPVADAAVEPAPVVLSTASPASAEPGAVVVLAGIGGPDAVRQFLTALPGDFPRPVIVRQRLDGGRHDRLVRQMQRATSLPVELAEAGAPLVPGHVYILPDGMATTLQGGAGSFVAAPDPVPVLAGLPAAGSAILMLSGSDPGMVADVQAAAQDGAMVAAQSPEECFDSAAPAALIAAGADAAPPSELSARLSARWPS